MSWRLGRFLLFAALLFLPAAALIVAVHQNHEARIMEKVDDATKQIQWHIDEATGAYSNSSLVNKTVRAFLAGSLEGRSGNAFSSAELRERFSKAHSRFVNEILPPHECYVIRVGTEPERIFTSKPSGSFDPIANDFAQIDHWKEISKSEAIPRLGELVRKHLHDRCGVLIPIDPLRLYRDDGLFLRTGDTSWLLFHSFVSPDLIIIFWINMGKNTLDHLPEFLVKNWNTPGEYVMMLPLTPGARPLKNSLLAQDRTLFTSLARSKRLTSPHFSVTRVGNTVICAAPYGSTGDYRLVVCRKLEIEDEWPFSAFFALGFILFFSSAGCFIAGERILFSRGPVFTVKRILPGAFLAVALLPLTGAGVVINRYLFETGRDRLDSLQRDLHQDLVDIDEGERAHIASFTNYIRSHTKRPDFDAYSDPHLGSPDLEKYFKDFLWNFNKSHDWVFHNLLVVVSDGRYFSIQCLFQDNTPPEVITTKDQNPIIQHMFKRGLHFMGIQDTDMDGAKSEGAALAEAVKIETFQEILLNLGGLTTYISLVFNPHELFEIKFLHEANFSMDTQFEFIPGLRVNCTWVWGCRALDIPYLKSYFSTLKPAGTRDRTVAMSGLKHERTISPESFVNERSTFASLYDLLNTSFQTQLSVRRKATDEPGRPVQEAYPARHLRGVIAGQRSTEQIDTDLEQLGKSAVFALAGMVAGAVLLGALAGIFFLLPLSELRRGISAISGGRYDFRIETSRSDEFGSIAGTFNHMARRLQEGQLLRSFVSDSVLEAIKTGSTDRMPRTCEITVLFSSLVGFDAFKKSQDASVVFSALQAHLSAVDAAVTKFGGEIDKIISDKVMVVFRHDVAGGGEKAAAMALNVARAVEPALIEQGIALKTAIGMNTGTVVSGVVGAAAARLDFTVIGDPVNLAARLATLAHTTSGTRIVLSGAIRDLAPRGTGTIKLPFREVKGKTQKIEAYLLS